MFRITSPENYYGNQSNQESIVGLWSIVEQNYILLKHSNWKGKRRYFQPSVIV